MLSGKQTVLFALILGASLTVLGCVSFPGSSSAPPPTNLLNPRREAKGEPPTDLRIPGSPLAQAKDIPLVPVPPVPRGSSEPVRPGKPNPPTNPIVPASATVPADPLTPPAPPPLPAPPASTPFIPVPNPALTPLIPIPTPPGPAVKPPPENPTAKPADRSPAAVPGDSVKRLQQQAVETYAKMDSYITRLTRREVVAGTAKPEEVMMFKFRKEPWSIYFKWLGKEGEGREVVYVKGMHQNQIHTLLANGDMPVLLMPANHRMSLAVDSLLVRSASRHSITEAGIGHCVEHLGRVIEGMERGDKKVGTLADLGMQQRPEYPKPLPMIEHSIPPGTEAELPRGGKRLYGFDPENHLPVLVITRDDRGQEVEYYRYDRLQCPVKLDADDFDPDKLWKTPVARSQAPNR